MFCFNIMNSNSVIRYIMIHNFMKALLTIMLVFPSFIIAQEKTAVILPDSTDVFIDGLEHFSEPLKMDDTKFKHEGLNREEIVILPYSDSVRLDPSRFKEKYYYPVHHIGDYNLGGPMFMFRNGMVVGSGSFVTLHGIGFLGKAKIGYIHQFNDRLSLGGYVNTTKFRTANYDFISLGTSGVLNYKLTDRRSKSVV